MTLPATNEPDGELDQNLLLPETVRDPLIKPNIYADPSKAIAPNGRYLIKFRVVKVTDRNAEPEA